MPNLDSSPSRTPRASALYQQLLAQARDPEPEPGLPVWIAARRCGWAREDVQAVVLRAPALAQVQADGLHLGENLAPGTALDAHLAQIAQRLRGAGLLPGWRDELLDVFDQDDRPFAVIERAATRAFGLVTRAVHLNAWHPDGRLWVARRALTKATDPGKWDTLVGGLVAHAEPLDIALVRECAEEAGLSEADLSDREPLRSALRIRRHLPEGYQVEDILVSDCVLPAETRPRNQDGEVMQIALIEPTQVLDMIEAGDFTLEAALTLVEALAHV